MSTLSDVITSVRVVQLLNAPSRLFMTRTQPTNSSMAAASLCPSLHLRKLGRLPP
jgi:hypothetical protein